MLQICYVRVFEVAEHEYEVEKCLRCTWWECTLVLTSSTRIVIQLTLKCVQIIYSGVFEVAEHEYEVSKGPGWTREVLQPGFDVIYGDFRPINAEMFPKHLLGSFRGR